MGLLIVMFISSQICIFYKKKAFPIPQILSNYRSELPLGSMHKFAPVRYRFKSKAVSDRGKLLHRSIQTHNSLILMLFVGSHAQKLFYRPCGNTNQRFLNKNHRNIIRMLRIKIPDALPHVHPVPHKAHDVLRTCMPDG